VLSSPVGGSSAAFETLWFIKELDDGQSPKKKKKDVSHISSPELKFNS
jgi:hypothetical protein